MKHPKKVLLNLIEDCLTYRLTEKESIEYIKERYQSITRNTLNNYKRHIESDETLNIYFNEHTRIGFVKEHVQRFKEMNIVLKGLLELWDKLDMTIQADQQTRIRLAHAIISVNNRLENISLANPVISKIKAEIDKLRRYEDQDTNKERPKYI